MNWKHLNFDWNQAKAFLVTAETGTFSAAAKTLQLTQPTLGRQVAALEEELGVVLIEKVGKALQLTPTGLELLEHVRQMAEAASRLAVSASGQSTEIEGVVRISASETYAAYLLPPLIRRLRKEQPKITIELLSSNQSSDLKRREADLAIRHYRPKHEDLIAKHLGQASWGFYAAPEYLQDFGPITSKEDFNRVDLVGLMEVEEMVRHLNGLGLAVDSRNFHMLANSFIAQWELVKAGVGVGWMMSHIGEREPRVCPVLPEAFPEMQFENWLVSHRDLKNSRRIRVVFDFLAEQFPALLR